MTKKLLFTFTLLFITAGLVQAQQDIDVQGNGVSIADGDTTPDLADHTDFGSVAVGNSVTRTFTIRNTGNATLTISSVSFSFPPDSHFQFNFTGFNTSVPASGSTTFDVTFTPTSATTFSETITIDSDDPDEDPYTFAIEGTGLSSPQDIEVEGNGISITNGDTTPDLADHTDFGNISVGSSVTRTYTINNTGGSDLIISSVNFSFPPDSHFQFDFTGFDTTIPANGSTDFDVTFTPTAVGALNETIIIDSNDPDEDPFTFEIRGTGILNAQDINVQGNSTNIANGDTTPDLADHTDFGNVNVGSSQTRTYTIQNTGGSDLIISSVNFSFPPDSHFQFDFTGFNTTISANGSTDFDVTFTPTSSGTITEVVEINSNDPDEDPYTFTISGTGIITGNEILVSGNGQEIVSGDTTPSTADDTDFGDADVTTGSVTHTFTIENQGSQDLNLTDPSPYVVISGTHASDFVLATIPSTPIAAAGTTTFSITFYPSALGVRTATVSIANDDADENPYTFAIQGEGIDAASGSPLLITQYYEGTGANNKWIEVKNISTSNVIPDAYYLAVYLDGRATLNGGIATNPPTESVAIPFLAPGEVALFHRSGATLPGPGNLGSAAAVIPTEVCRFNGNDVILISASNGNNTYNDRIDIIGEVKQGSTVNWGVDKVFLKGCGTTEFPVTTFSYDYIELALDDVNNADPTTNLALGTQTVGPTIWAGSWNNGKPDISKNAIVNGVYNAADGSFEACNLVVNASGNLNLDGGTTNYVSVENNLTVNGPFVIGDTESLITVNGNAIITGQITKKETTTPLNNFRDYTYWSSPVEGADLGTVFAGVQRIYEWVIPDTGNPWSTEDDVWDPASGIMERARGYIAEAHPSTPDGGTYTVSFTGKPYNGTVPIKLGINDDGPTTDNDFNLIGNPYPSAIDIDEFILYDINTPINNGGTDGTIWVWTHRTPISHGTWGGFTTDDYATYNLVGGSGSGTGSISGSPAPTYNIGSSQGFFVRAIQAGDVNFENSMRLKDENDQFFKPSDNKKSARPEKDRIWLNIHSATGGASNQILVGFMDGATDGVDRGYDALRLSAAYVNFYSTIDSLKYVIQGVGSFNMERKINLGVDTYIDQEMDYTISLGEVEGQLKSNDIYLVDHELNVVHDLNKAPYTFTLLGKGKNFNRFTLQFTSAVLDVDEFGVDNNFYIVNEDNSLQIKSNNVIERLKVYDVTGRLLINQEPNDSNFTVSMHSIRKGTVLILNATFSNGAEISKKGIKY